MVTYNIRFFVSIVLGLAFLTYGSIFFLTQDLASIDWGKAVSSISSTITINIIFWTLFIKWGWKLRIFYPWLVPFPNLSGEWQGSVSSNWDKGDSNLIPVEATIYQTFFRIQVTVKSSESKSQSIGANFDIDQDRGINQILYSYLNTPKTNLRDRSGIHYGSVRLEFEGFKVISMTGEYWTSRQTTGEIALERKVSK